MTEQSPIYYLPPGTLVEYDGQSVVVKGHCAAGIIVRDRSIRPCGNSDHFVIEHSKWIELIGRLDVQIIQDFGSDSTELAALHSTSRLREAEWAEANEDDKLLAKQKEAWCLAVQSVLKGRRYTETQIKRNYEVIQQRALDRQRLLARGNDKNGDFKAHTWGPKRVSDFCKAYFSDQNPSPRTLLRVRAKGKGQTKLPDDVERLLKACCEHYLNKAQPSKASIVKLTERVFRLHQSQMRKSGRLAIIDCPHRNTIYSRLSKTSELRQSRGRNGLNETIKNFSPTQAGVRALKPGELIEIDFWKGDVLTFIKKSEYWGHLSPDLQQRFRELAKKQKNSRKKKKTQRLWICVALDVATRMIVGIGFAETPNSRTVIEVIDMITRDKSDISRLAGCKTTWWQHCGIGTISVDTGAEFFNSEVQDAITALGASYVYGRTGVPSDKPFIERLFRSFRTMIADELPGKTGYSPDCLVAYDSENMAVFNADQLRHLMIRSVVDYYSIEKHSGLRNMRPVKAWRDAEKYGVLCPPLPRTRRNATGLKLSRRLTKQGITFLGMSFANSEMFPSTIMNGNKTVEVRIDPNDLREITAVIDGKLWYLENQYPELAHHSVRTLMAAIAKMTESRKGDTPFYDYVLAKHADFMVQKIEAGIETHGLPSTEVSAETIDHFEKMYFLRLQMEKSPERAASANIDDLLSGKSGKGIFTAEEVALEKAEYQASREGKLIDANQNPERDTESPTNQGAEASTHEKNQGPNSKLNPKNSGGKLQRKPSSKGRYEGRPKGKGSF